MDKFFNKDNTEWGYDEEGEEHLLYQGDVEEFCEENNLTTEEFEDALLEYEEEVLENEKTLDTEGDARAYERGGRWDSPYKAMRGEF